jgi:DNA-binding CsgD family transcriptional regulator
MAATAAVRKVSAVLVTRPNRGLSPRQRQIIGLIALGLSDKEIGAQLNLSPHTVRTYLERLFQNLGCRTRTRAVALWLSGDIDSAVK